MIRNSIHEMAIQRVQAKWAPQAVYRNGLQDRLREIDARFEMLLEPDDRLRRIPDAWSYVPHHTTEHPGTIYLFEVENEHSLSEDKLCDYAMFYNIFDFYNCDVRLFVYDRYGENEREINLQEYYFMFTIAAADKRDDTE